MESYLIDPIALSRLSYSLNLACKIGSCPDLLIFFLAHPSGKNSKGRQNLEGERANLCLCHSSRPIGCKQGAPARGFLFFCGGQYLVARRCTCFGCKMIVERKHDVHQEKRENTFQL